MMKARRSNGLMANEAIAVQFDDFPKKLDRLIEHVYELIDNGADRRKVQNSPFIEELQKVIFERLGLKTKIDVASGLAQVMPMYLNANNVLGDNRFHGLIKDTEIEKLLKKNQFTGTVDLKNVRVGGVFSEYTHDVGLNFHALKKYKITPEELTAILLHELGHAFTYCYYSSRLNSTNQVLADVARHLLANDQQGELEYVYVNLKKVNNDVKKEEVDRLLNGPKVVSSLKWFMFFKQTVESLISNSFYDQTSSEERADQFVSRFGRGKEVVLALEKAGNNLFRKSFLLFTHYRKAMEVLSPIIGVFRRIYEGNSTEMIFGLYSKVFLFSFIFLLGDRSTRKDMTYDNMKVRYTRLRNDAVNQLKINGFTKEQTRAILDSIYMVDEVVKKTYDLRTLPNYIADLIFLDSRAAMKTYDEQRLLESLSSNDLFIQSAELRLA